MTCGWEVSELKTQTPVGASRLAPTGVLHFSCEISGLYVELRRDRVRSNADLFVDGMRGYWASSAQRTQL
ncbi:LysR_substrate domain-containing protein [Pseudomonas sp. IT-P171]